MITIKSYQRTQTSPEGAGIVRYNCVDCGETAEVFCIDEERDTNKYLKSGLCHRCFEIAVETALRRPEGLPRPARVDRPTPGGKTVSVKEAARILNTSASTLKRKAADWGIPVFWDGRGRKFAVADLNRAKRGLLVGRPSQSSTEDIDALTTHPMADHYRLRAYRVGDRKGYIGLCEAQEPCEVVNWVSLNFGPGKYRLKLLTDAGKMTPHNFVVNIPPHQKEPI